MSAPERDSEAADTVEAEASSAVAEGHAAREQLLRQGQSGADWFYWIAGLSLVNTAIVHFGGNVHFVVGLGITEAADAIAHALADRASDSQKLLITAGAVGFSVLCSLIACLVGWLSRRRMLVIYGLGMFVYLLDGLLYVAAQDWLSVAFHGFALFCMWGGFTAFRQLSALEQQLELTDETA
jgi:hypothetical protein